MTTMDDLRERMERLAGRVDGAAAPDLVEARERVTRRRTRSAMAVGLGVIVVGAVLAASAIQQPATTPAPPANDGSFVLPDVPTIWPPAGTADGAEWRHDPEQVIRRFTQSVLGWSDPGIQNIDAVILLEPGTPGSYYEVTPEPCGAAARCLSLTVVVDQDPTAAWGVINVWSEPLNVETPGGDFVPTLSGGTLAFEMDIPDHRSAHVGIVATNGCRQASSYEIGLDAGTFELEVPASEADDPACSDVGAGYAFAYVTDDTTEPVGDPLLEAAAIEYPWLTVVPIHLVMETSEPSTSASSTELTIVCGANETMAVSAEPVVATAEGVHVRIEGPDTPFRVAIDDEVTSIAQTPQDEVLPLAPGLHQARCAGDGAAVSAEFEVVDPEGHWFDYSVDCAPPGEEVDLDADALDVGNDPDAAILAAGEDILRSAIDAEGPFRFGGYPEERFHRSVVMLDDQGLVLGVAHFSLNGQDWFPDGYVTCEGQAVF
jgi:hypothetical protein